MNYLSLCSGIEAATTAWLRELIARKLIMDGEVDERSITDVSPDDLVSFTRCHFFAGLGLWDHALRLAGWPEGRPVWTGSCPCQPFSIAGKGLGEKDERHLWPVFRDLIDARQPPVAFGEQVASKDGRTWLAGVFADLEGMGYQRAGADLCAAGIGSPHIRQRLYWVANADHQRRAGIDPLLQRQASGRQSQDFLEAAGGCTDGGLANTKQPRRTETGLRHEIDARRELEPGRSLGRLGDARGEGLEGHRGNGNGGSEPGRVGSQPVGSTAEAGNTGSDWYDTYWHPCRDGKHRRVPVEPEFFPLADAGIYVVPGMARRRTVRPPLLRGSGNAIVPQVAAEFIAAYLEA